ncbi:MAG TPA: ribosome maturation factor RimM [Candidatus Aquilonibacter sp.]
MRKKLPQPTKVTPTRENDIPIGRIAGLFGVRGELKCDPTSAGRALFVPGAQLQCAVDGRIERVTIESVREHKGRLLVALEEAHDATAAERFIDATFFAPREALDVAPGEYLDVDLVGCAVVGRDGKPYGSVERVEHYPASDMLVVSGRLLPMVAAFIKHIDTKKKEIVVDDLPAGLLDGEPLA